MRIIDSHFHWWPRKFFEQLCNRTDYPRAERNEQGGFRYWRHADPVPGFDENEEWFDLEWQLERMDRLGHDVSVISSIGPLSIHFSDLNAEEGRREANLWNEEVAEAQSRLRGRFWGTAAVPLIDTEIAIQVLNYAICELGLVGIDLPGSVGSDPRIDAERLEPFYARVAELGVPLLLHPTDAIFAQMLGGYGGALHLTLGRVIEVSVAAMRLILSGIMERYPGLKLIMSHTGGALPYQAGRMDKNAGAAGLINPPSTYIRRMFTDTVSPHAPGMKFAVEYYGTEQILYGSDYPCWDPDKALELLNQIGLTETQIRSIFWNNSARVFNLANV